MSKVQNTNYFNNPKSPYPIISLVSVCHFGLPTALASGFCDNCLQGWLLSNRSATPSRPSWYI